SAWAQDSVNDLDRLVFGLQLYRGLFSGILVSVSVPCTPRDRHGGGMASRRCPSNGAVADPLARLYGCGFASLVGARHDVVERGLRSVVRLDRLARPAVDWCSAGAVDHLCAVFRQRA